MSDNRREKRGLLAATADFSIRYPVSICMILLSFLVLGVVSMGRIPLVLLPDITAPFLAVVVPYPNATPEQIQETITKPLEEVLGTIPHVTLIRSTSTASQATVVLNLSWAADIEFLRSEVRARVEQARKDLPDDVVQILVQNFNTNDIPVIEGRISSGRDLRGSYDFLDLKIKKPLERVPGVAEVTIGGVERREIEIMLRLDDLKLYGIDVGSLFDRLDSANLNVSLGRVEDSGYRYGIITDGAVRSLEELLDFPINERGLRLRDVADVELKEPDSASGRHLNGDFAVALQIRKASDANTVNTVRRVIEQIDALNADPSLQGIEVLVWHDSGREITKSLLGLLNAGLVGAGLAIVVLFLFLRRLGATLAIGFAIPFSIIAAVGFLYLLGNSLNVLSMMGLMLSTGMLVDNAIVVLESILRRIEQGEERESAARLGTREVLRAVIASTLTSVIIFVPLVFGKRSDLSVFLGHTGVAIIITLFCSLFVSITLIPLGVARMMKTDSAQKGAWQLRVEEWIGRFRKTRAPASKTSSVPPRTLLSSYLRLMTWTLSHRAPVAVISLAVLGGSFAAASLLKDSSPEAQELSDVSVEYEFHDNYHYAKIEADFVNPVEEFLFSNRERFKIKDVYSYYANNEANTRLYFDTEQLDLGQLPEIRKQISEGLPVIAGAEIQLRRQDGEQSDNWMGVNIHGDDPAVLQQLAQQVRLRLSETGQFEEVFTELDRGNQEVQVRLQREVAKRFGISPQSVSQVLGIVLRGQRIRGFRTAEGEVEIWIRLQPSDREDLDDLKSMVVGNSSEGRPVLLSQVADFNLVRTPGAIQRENRITYTEVAGNYSGSQREEGIELAESVLNEISYPAGYGWSFGFWTLQESQEQEDFLFNVFLALFMVYFVMASLFESLVQPLAIMVSLLFASVGVIWFLLLTGTPFNIMAMIGVLILIGIVVNNGIVLIDHVNELRRSGKARSEAILEGCRERFRPILMTASTTVVGLMPLALGSTSLFDLRYFPMARTVMGGLIVSTVLTLVVLPTAYTLIDDLAEGLGRVWRASAVPPSRIAPDPAHR